MIVLQRVRVLPNLFIQTAHQLNLVIRHTGSLQQSQVLFVLESCRAMTGFPIMNENLCVLRLVTQRTRESAMVFVCVSKHDTTDVPGRQAVLSEPCAQGLDGFSSLGAGIDDRDRIFFDKIDVDGANVERSWK